MQLNSCAEYDLSREDLIEEVSHQPVVSVTIFPLCGLSLSFPRQSRYPYQLMRGTILMRPDLLGTISCPLPSTIVLYKYRL